MHAFDWFRICDHGFGYDPSGYQSVVRWVGGAARGAPYAPRRGNEGSGRDL